MSAGPSRCAWPWRFPGRCGWGARSLTTRITLLFSFISAAIVFTLGAFLYMSARSALETSTDYALIGRVEHFRTLLQDMYNTAQLEARPAVFESMLGNERDVFLFKRPGQPAFIRINPDHLSVPPLQAVPVGQQVSRGALYYSTQPDGTKIRWAAVQAQTGPVAASAHRDAVAPAGGAPDPHACGMVEIVAGHVMTQEVALLRDYERRIFFTSVVAVLLTAWLAHLVLTRGLRPLHAMAERAAQITPRHLSARLPEGDVPLELRRLTLAFNAMLDRLADGYERLSQFSADLAHEIRTPVGVLVGQTQVTLAQARSSEEYEGVLESNLEELERIGRIIENILFLAQADHDALAIERVPLDMAMELTHIAEYFEGLAQERDLQFRIEASGTVHANPMLWRRAVNNLVVNAVRYADAGTVITLCGERQGAQAVIAVEDRGAPLASGQIERVFDRFYRGDTARSGATESNGLGLAIVKAIMALHGGTAQAVCSPAGVIRFTLNFPVPG